MVAIALLAVDASDEARLDDLVASAAAVVSPDGTVVVLHAFGRGNYADLAERLDVESGADGVPDQLARQHGVASTAADRLQERGVEVTVQGTVGEGGEEILRVSEDVGADMVVVGGRRRSPSGKALFGSTAQQVLLEADAPVVFVKEGVTEERSDR